MRKTKTTAAEVALNKSIIIQQITQTQREAVAAVRQQVEWYEKDTRMTFKALEDKTFENAPFVYIISLWIIMKTTKVQIFGAIWLIYWNISIENTVECIIIMYLIVNTLLRKMSCRTHTGKLYQL